MCNKYVKSSSITKAVFFIGILMLPFVFWPWASVPFEVPRVWFFNRWVEVLGVVGILAALGTQFKNQKSKCKILIESSKLGMVLPLFVVSYLVVAISASIFGVNSVKSLIGNYYRGDGLFTLFHLVGLFFFVNLFWEKAWGRDLIRIIGWGAVGLGTLGILGKLGILGGWGLWVDGTIGTTFGNPNFLGGYLLICLPPVRRLGYLGLLGCLVVITATVLTGSRGAMVGVGIWGILEIVLGLSSKYSADNLLDKGRLGVLGIIIIVTGFLGGLGYLNITRDGGVFEGRERILRKAGMAFVQRPVLGWGLANFDYAFKANDWPIKYNNDVYVDKAHSTIVENFVTLGILGGLGWLGVVIIILIQLVKLVRLDRFDDFSRMLLIAFLLYLFHSQTNIISINEEMLFWLIGGVVASGGLLAEG